MALVHRRPWSAAARHESGWYFPLRALWDALRAERGFPSPEQLSALYAARVAHLTDLPPEVARLRFSPAPPKKKRRARRPVALSELYEGRIVERAEVPTRLDDWHDFFNALSFAAFPRAKWALHLRQYQLLSQRVGPHTRRLPGARTREQDALALFDEGGIALLVEPACAGSLDPAGDLGDAARALCQAGTARAVPFGHALYEHLIEDLPCPLGALHPVVLSFAGLRDAALLDALDRRLARDLADPALFLVPSPARGLSLAEISAPLQETPPNSG